MDLQAVLAKSKQVMDKTKDLPYGGYIEQSGTAVNNKNGDVMFEQRVASNDGEPMFSESVASKSKLPKEIIDAVRNSSSMESDVSVTSGLKLKKPKPQRNPYEMITEEAVPSQTASGSSIDYSLIRMMIEESMKKYISQLKKSLISESKSNNGGGLQMMTKQGNKFRFVTEDGKIFEANLVYKGNINEK